MTKMPQPTPAQDRVIRQFNGDTTAHNGHRTPTETTYKICERNGWIEQIETWPYHRTTQAGADAIGVELAGAGVVETYVPATGQQTERATCRHDGRPIFRNGEGAAVGNTVQRRGEEGPDSPVGKVIADDIRIVRAMVLVSFSGLAANWVRVENLVKVDPIVERPGWVEAIDYLNELSFYTPAAGDADQYNELGEPSGYVHRSAG
jgi:hypothetical protein